MFLQDVTVHAGDSISDAVTRLFELKRYPELAQNLPLLNENVR